MTLPASSKTISPGTTSDVGIKTVAPPLNTAAAGAAICFKASIAFSALYSCTKPMTAFTTTITTIAAVSAASPIMPAMTAAAIRTIIMKSLNWSRNIPRGVFFFTSFSSFGPYS